MLRRIQPHVPGLIYSGLIMLVGVAAMNNQNNLLFWVLGILAAGLILSAAISWYMMRSLQIRRADPQHGSVGEPLMVRYSVTNRSRLLSAFNIHIEERKLDRSMHRDSPSPPGAWIMHVGPRETVHGEAIFWPTQRGRFAFTQMRAWTTFPFGIVRKHVSIQQPQHTLIFPMLYRLRPDVLRSLSPKALLGTKVSHHAGAGDDYYGTREYRPGDSMRNVAWKRTARLDQLITIERTSPSPAKLRVVLDLTEPTAALAERLRAARDAAERPGNPSQAARDLEERAISLAASIVHAADLAGYEIGITIMGVASSPIAVRRNRWHFNKIMAALAEVDLGATRIAPLPQPIRDAERSALVVVAPDRVHPLPGRDDAWYLSARQLDRLAAGPIGWDAARREVSSSAASTGRVEAAA